MSILFLTSEAAKMLRISEEYLRELIRQRKIQAYKEGRRGGYRITKEAIDKYIKRKHDEAVHTPHH